MNKDVISSFPAGSGFWRLQQSKSYPTGLIEKSRTQPSPATHFQDCFVKIILEGTKLRIQVLGRLLSPVYTQISHANKQTYSSLEALRTAFFKYLTKMSFGTSI